ncbi:MAG: GNAT family N-acetyltransferase [Planctomycetota bacterium]|nr:GNAT family N-acetyltransferase [Planctomycetota bacterium]
MNEVLVRAAVAEDFGSIAALTTHFILHTPIHFGTTPDTADALREAWEKSRDRYPFLVAEVGGEFAGFAKAGRWRDRAAYDRTAEAGIYVRPEMHGRGVGKRLYAGLLGDCRGRGFHTVVGGVTMPNEASVRLHEGAGFRLVGVFREVGHKMGAWRDVAWYQVML